MRRQFYISSQWDQGLLQLPAAPPPGELRKDHGKDAYDSGISQKGNGKTLIFS
jgi:hypothetical protein